MTDDVHQHKIIEKDGEWCVTSEDGSRSFGCYPTKDEAVERLRQVEGHKGMKTTEHAEHKTEDGVEYPSDAYAYVPDPGQPSTWKLRLWETPDKKATKEQVGRALAAIGPGGFRGRRVQVPEDDRPAVVRRLRAAWRSVHDENEEMPDVLKKGTFSQEDDEVHVHGLDLKDVEIFRTGKWNGDEYTTTDLDDMVEAFGQAGFRPPVKIGHREESGDPAYGWVANIRRVGERLFADLTDLPKTIYEAIKNRRFDAVSAEIFWNFKREGRTLRRVLKGVALLGAEIPAVAGLKPLRESFKGLAWENVASYTIEKDEIMADDPKNTAKDEESEAKVAELTQQVAELTAKLEAAEAEKKKATQKTQADDSALQIKKLNEQIAELQKKNAEAAEAQRQAAIAASVRDVRIPALRDHFFALYDMATKEPERTLKFKMGDGDEAQVKDVPPIKVIDDLRDRLNRHTEKLLLSEHAAVSRDVLRRDDAPPSDDPDAELNRLTRAYMARTGEKNYATAFQAILNDPENAELKRAYASVGAD